MIHIRNNKPHILTQHRNGNNTLCGFFTATGDVLCQGKLGRKSATNIKTKNKEQTI